MIDLKQFKIRHKLFAKLDYDNAFAGFWGYKTKTETENNHILDNNFGKETYRRLCWILPKWHAYRGVPGIKWMEVLKDSLSNMSEAYNQIRNYSLLVFDEVPIEPLQLIWHELGRVKETNGKRDDNGMYYVVAVTKPLMFLWGQTVAFDSYVRSRAPLSDKNLRYQTKWSFEDWRRNMIMFQEELKRLPEHIEHFKQVSHEKFGNDSAIPYGQFLDLYYWVG